MSSAVRKSKTLTMDFPEEGDGCAKFVLQASNFKVFHKAINAIAKISTTLSVEPTKQGLTIRALNPLATAYFIIRFNEHFFSALDMGKIDLEQDSSVKLSIKSLLVAFKSANFTEKTHIQVDMRIHPEKDNFIMEMLLVNDVKRLYRVRVCDNKRQMPKKLSADKAKMANKLGCSPDTLLPIIEQMRNKSDELVVHAQRERIHFKNYQRDGAEKRTKLISEATWMSAQFNSMNIRRETEINFSAKEFKAILSFASQQGANVTLYFDQPSKPLIIVIDGDITYDAEFHLSTVDVDTEDADTTQVERIPTQPGGVVEEQEYDSFDDEPSTSKQEPRKSLIKGNKRSAVEIEREPIVLLEEQREGVSFSRPADEMVLNDPFEDMYAEVAGPSSAKKKSLSPKQPIIERGLSATPPPSRRQSLNVTANRVSAMRLNSSKSPAAEQSAFPCISPDWVPDNNDLAMETDFGAVNQPLDDDADRIPASPERPPPNKRDKKYRNFMMSTAHATQHASQRLTQQAWGHETMSRTKS